MVTSSINLLHSMYPEHKVGSRFQIFMPTDIPSEMYETVINDGGCECCDCREFCASHSKAIGLCTSQSRLDKNNVVFKRLKQL